MVKLDKDNNIKNNIFTEEIKKEIKEINSGSLANGLLMRISPILCWFYMVNRDYIRKILDTKNNEKYYELYSKIFVQIEKDSQLTHPNRENTVAGAIFIFMGICAMEQKYSGNEILNMIEILFNGNNFNKIIEEKTLKNHFINIISDIKKEDFTEDIYFGNLSHLMGYYLHSFKLTLYYLYKLDEMKKNLNIKDIYNKIIFSICDFGGDTDTNAAIVGMIIGPLIGIKNFDNKYLDVFLNFYSKKRIIYTNSLMYYFALYLINATKNENYYNSNFGEKINSNYFKIIYDFIYKKL
jgi:ADP-ribosylglycohydrolase